MQSKRGYSLDALLLASLILAAILASAFLTLADRPALAAAAPTAPAVERWEYLGLVRASTRADDRYELATPASFDTYNSLTNLMHQRKYDVQRPGIENNLNVNDLLNVLGSQGWELVSHTTMFDNANSLRRETWTFKRRAP